MSDDADLVLVTGVSGFIAKHVALRLLGAGYRVRGTVRTLARGENVRRTLAAHGADIGRLQLVEADLLRDAGWDEAAAGCRFVQHMASPFPSRLPRDRLALVPVAKGGTLRVLGAAEKAGAERVVLTSSVAAVYYGHQARTERRFTEADVSDVESPTISAYALSKTLAELAAWDAVRRTALPLAVVNPAFVLGPLLDAEAGTSASVIAAMMKGRAPVVPNVALGIVDVRDVAEAHLAAMTTAKAAGRRFILSGGSRTLCEIGASIAASHPAYRRRLPRATLPDGLVRAAGRVSSRLAQLVPELGARKILVTEPAETVLGLRFRTPEEAIGAMAESLVRHGLA